VSAPSPPLAKPPAAAPAVGKPVLKPLDQRVTFEQLIHKVQQAEDVLEMRERGVASSYQRLCQAWKTGWTPLRIVTVGLASGFLTGRAEPLRTLTGARMLQMASALSGLFASAQASFAADQAQEAADSAEDIATGAPARPAAPATHPSETDDELPPVQPRPAEAATELSHP
jgi:hypothetical protein